MLLRGLKAGEKRVMEKKDRKVVVDEEELKTIAKIMEEIENDHSVKELMERNQRKYGTLTESDLKKAFTI